MVLLGNGCSTLRLSQVREARERGYNPATGKFAHFEDPLFNWPMIETGLWKSQRFVKGIGFGIFFTEPHRPDALPVLLLHGYEGGPREMAALASALKSDSFELWYGFYATGEDLEKSAVALRASVLEVAAHEGVSNLVIVAFSSGGLIAREAVSRIETANLRIPLLAAISTPWNGVTKAGKWAWLPGAPRCWKDLKPGSKLLVKLFQNPLPKETRLHLIYATGDDVVSLESLARLEARQEATSVTVLEGYRHLDHEFHQKVVQRLKELIAELVPKRPPP
jgi:hypothetical protein